MTTVNLSSGQYEALLDYAWGRRTDLGYLRDLQRSIDEANGVRRYVLRIRWMERGGSPPSPISYSSWPPTQEFTLRQDRAIDRNDVDTVLSTQAINPVDVLVTKDENGVVGWAQLDVYNFYE